MICEAYSESSDVQELCASPGVSMLSTKKILNCSQLKRLLMWERTRRIDVLNCSQWRRLLAYKHAPFVLRKQCWRKYSRLSTTCHSKRKIKGYLKNCRKRHAKLRENSKMIENRSNQIMDNTILILRILLIRLKSLPVVPSQMFPEFSHFFCLKQS